MLLAASDNPVVAFAGPSGPALFDMGKTAPKKGPAPSPISTEWRQKDFKLPDHLLKKEHINNLKAAMSGLYAPPASGFTSSYYDQTIHDTPWTLQALPLEAERQLAKLTIESHKDDAEEAMRRDFQGWLQGREIDGPSPHYQGELLSRREQETYDNTSWGEKSLLSLPGVSQYFDTFVDARVEFEKRLAHLILRGPHDLTSAWYYYKFVVHGVAAGKEEQLTFLQLYDLPKTMQRSSFPPPPQPHNHVYRNSTITISDDEEGEEEEDDEEGEQKGEGEEEEKQEENDEEGEEKEEEDPKGKDGRRTRRRTIEPSSRVLRSGLKGRQLRR